MNKILLFLILSCLITSMNIPNNKIETTKNNPTLINKNLKAPNNKFSQNSVPQNHSTFKQKSNSKSHATLQSQTTSTVNASLNATATSNPFDLKKINSTNTDQSATFKTPPEDQMAFDYNPMQSKLEWQFNWLQMPKLPDFFLLAQDDDVKLIQLVKQQVNEQQQSQDYFQDIEHQLVKFEKNMNKSIDKQYSKSLGTYNMRERFQELKDQCLENEDKFKNMGECLRMFSQNLMYKFETQAKNSIIAFLITLIEYNQYKNQFETQLQASDEALNILKVKNLHMFNIKNNIETRKLALTLNEMKITLNLVKHINFTLQNQHEEENLNERIEQCEEQINDDQFIKQSKEMSINQFNTLEIESILDSVLNTWNQDWRIYEYQRQHLPRLERVVERSTNIKDRELQCMIAHIEVFFKSPQQRERIGGLKSVNWEKIFKISSTIDDDLSGIDENSYHVQHFYNLLITVLYVSTFEGEILLKFAILIVDIVVLVHKNFFSNQNEIDRLEQVWISFALESGKNSLVRILSIKQLFWSIENQLNLKIENGDDQKSKSQRGFFQNILVLLEFLLIASKLFKSLGFSNFLNTLIIQVSGQIIAIESLLIFNAVTLITCLYAITTFVIDDYIKPIMKQVGITKSNLIIEEVVGDGDRNKINVIHDVQGYSQFASNNKPEIFQDGTEEEDDKLKEQQNGERDKDIFQYINLSSWSSLLSQINFQQPKKIFKQFCIVIFLMLFFQIIFQVCDRLLRENLTNDSDLFDQDNDEDDEHEEEEGDSGTTEELQDQSHEINNIISLRFKDLKNKKLNKINTIKGKLVNLK